MKRCLFLFLFAFCLVSCANARTPESIARLVTDNESRLLEAVEEMRALSSDRLFVAIETSEGESVPRLVSFVKESDKHEPLENDLLFSVLRDFSLSRIHFQTASDGRQSVIFSCTADRNAGVQNGFYYSFDGTPLGDDGRATKLVKQKKRYVRLNADGSAWYYTTPLTNAFYYFEKTGDLIG